MSAPTQRHNTSTSSKRTKSSHKSHVMKLKTVEPSKGVAAPVTAEAKDLSSGLPAEPVEFLRNYIKDRNKLTISQIKESTRGRKKTLNNDARKCKDDEELQELKGLLKSATEFKDINSNAKAAEVVDKSKQLRALLESYHQLQIQGPKKGKGKATDTNIKSDAELERLENEHESLIQSIKQLEDDCSVII